MVKHLLFVVILSLLLIHEMDAIRTKEWKMFIGLKNLSDEKGYVVFTLIHLPLYFAALLILGQNWETAKLILFYIIDGFVILHAIIHFAFKRHPDNGFNSIFSKIVIYSMPALAAAHISLLIFLH